MFLVANCLVQNLHHSRLFLEILNQHAASLTNIFDDIDDFSKARCSAASLREACEAEVGALTMLENDEELNYEGDWLHFEICSCFVSVSSFNTQA
jgi:hypothetical protein